MRESPSHTHSHTHMHTHTHTPTHIYTHAHKRAAGINRIAEPDAQGPRKWPSTEAALVGTEVIL